MSIKTISLIFMQENATHSLNAFNHAVSLAARLKAHLAIAIGVAPMFVPVDAPAVDTMIWAEQDNQERRKAAQELMTTLAADAALAGVSMSHEIDGKAYDPVFARLVHFARVSDLCVLPAPTDDTPSQQDLIVELLMGSGVPVLIIPANWTRSDAIGKAIVAWDGSAPAARAVRDATALLATADEVEIVAIRTQKDTADEVSSAEIATHLSRHCRVVRASDLPVQNNDVAETLRQHAQLVHADLIVMGGYGHSRVREFLMGGVTRSVLQRIEIPTMLSH